MDGLEKVLASIQGADDAGLKVKINAVVVRGWNDDEVVDFARFARFTGLYCTVHRVYAIRRRRHMGTDLVFSKREMIQRINKNVKELVPLNKTNFRACNPLLFCRWQGFCRIYSIYDRTILSTIVTD